MNVRTRLALLLSVSALALVGCGNDTTPTAADPKPGNGSGTHQDDSSPADPDESDSDSSATTTVPVYFVGDTPQGARLYREFRKVEADNPAVEALALMTAGDTLDADYRTAYAVDGTFADVEIDDDAIEVSLPDESWTTLPDGMTEEDARLAAQQLVYTVQGIAQDRLPVEIVLDGEPADLFGFGGQIGNEPELDVRAMVNVTSPEEGASVSGSFTASGVSSSFEATTPWEIRDSSGTAVKNGFATAEGWMDKLYPWETEVDVSGLEPGTYTFVALTDDPSSGEGGGPTEDTKTIIVG
ncbi:Gmad2 immunoglobulin-like domain-containing protein [Nocardioides sp. SR21]|uniref:Gmad2 immunoglobulin-like domain-containing protein n=1 Tax=Nocardioides sp. SR21 TaxID=2919501 RepID=UPI001FA9E9B6|nr:Gmad2 immunoglobulin-like domain-containing protein [Nocardioides sp. SR21]